MDKAPWEWDELRGGNFEVGTECANGDLEKESLAGRARVIHKGEKVT